MGCFIDKNFTEKRQYKDKLFWSWGEKCWYSVNVITEKEPVWDPYCVVFLDTMDETMSVKCVKACIIKQRMEIFLLQIEAEVYQDIKKVYCNGCLTCAQIFNCFSKFKKGRESLADG